MIMAGAEGVQGSTAQGLGYNNIFFFCNLFKGPIFYAIN